MRLILMRHGIAVEHTDPGCPVDSQRFLTPEGIEKTREAARGLRALGLRPQTAFSSPLKRARQTAEITLAELSPAEIDLSSAKFLLPDTPPGEFLSQLEKLPGDEVICFGHAPCLDLAVAVLVGTHRPVTRLKKAGVAVIRVDSHQPEASLLEMLLTPRTLRLLGGKP